MSESRITDLHVVELIPDEWTRLRDIRLRALQADPEAFGATFETESAYEQDDWRGMFSKANYLVAVINDVDVATMSIENLKGPAEDACWIGGCWVDASLRGQGVMRTFMTYVDNQAQERAWTRQGLGVWQDNLDALTAYERLGFTKRGEPQPSTRQPGKFYQRMFRDV